MNLSTLASCIMTAVISTGGQQTTQLHHLESYWYRGNDDTPFLQDEHISALAHFWFSRELTVLAHACHGSAKPTAMQSLTFLHIDKSENNGVMAVDGHETIEGKDWPDCHQCNKQSANEIDCWVPV